jgi:hypothetical protein
VVDTDSDGAADCNCAYPVTAGQCKLPGKQQGVCFSAVPWPGPAYADMPFRDSCAAHVSHDACVTQIALMGKTSKTTKGYPGVLAPALK